MLTPNELLKEITMLPIPEQREIVKKVSRHIEYAEESSESGTDKFQPELSEQERLAIAKSLSGSLKPDSGYTPMTKEEDREVIEEYLAEKYG